MTELGIFKKYAPSLFEKELSIIPLEKGQKYPLIKEWSRFSKELPSEEEFSHWLNTDANGNIGLVCGEASGIICLDIDRLEGEEFTKKLLAELPPLYSGKIGNPHRPPARFFRYSGEVNRTFKNISIEILSNGRQTVLPPSKHPEFDHYTWVGNSFLSLDIDELPVLSPDFLNWLEVEDDLARSVAKTGAASQSQELTAGRCRHGSHNKISAYGVANVYTMHTEHLVREILKYDQWYNKDADCLYFECPSRNWKSKDKEENAKGFVSQLVANHGPGGKLRDEAKHKELSFEEPEFETKDDGFYFLIKDDAGKTKKRIPDYYGFADYIADKFKMYSEEAFTYVYENDFYHPIGDIEMDKVCTKVTNRKAKPSDLNNFKRIAYSESFGSKDRFDATTGLVNLKNGILDVESRTLMEHSSKYFFKYRLAHDFDPSAECPRFKQFLSDSFEGDDERIKAALEIMGYCLQGGAQWLHKAIVLPGSGRNGKSTFISVLEAARFLIWISHLALLP